VNWYHAIAFCNKLSIAEGLNPVYSVAGVDFSSLAYADIPLNEDAAWSTAAADWDANGYRLPTEMEWNWAAMGAAGYFGKLYSGWNGRGSAGDCAWYSANSANKTHGVGAKQANELGIFDMSGNVWEWCWDLNGALPTGALADYRGAATGGDRVMKGGGWMDYETTLVLSYRLKYTPSIRGGNVGFRVARNPAPRE
jgi:formylglycine-generating enzyme required for sulfatase activity